MKMIMIMARARKIKLLDKKVIIMYRHLNNSFFFMKFNLFVFQLKPLAMQM